MATATEADIEAIRQWAADSPSPHALRVMRVVRDLEHMRSERDRLEAELEARDNAANERPQLSEAEWLREVVTYLLHTTTNGARRR